MLTEGFLSHQEGVKDTREKIGLVVGDGGVETVVRMAGIGK